MTRPALRWILSVLFAGIFGTVAVAESVAPPSLNESIEKWRLERLAALKSDDGWLTLVALLPLNQGSNSFGRDVSNAVRINNPAVAARAGRFTVAGNIVTLDARRNSGITFNGRPVSHLQLETDAKGVPTVLALGPLRFFVIERVGNLFLRVRDVANPRRSQFKGLEYFPIDPAWHTLARFEAYTPAREITIMNILGLEQKMLAPGALVFDKDGRSWRLDAIDEDPQSDELFVMFADGTTGRETYGAGRFLYVPRPRDGTVALDFNRAYNPPCAFNDFATCPLPPPQNKLALRIEAGEKKYQH